MKNLEGVVMQVMCDEPTGKVLRTVRWLWLPSYQKMQWIAERLLSVPNMLELGPEATVDEAITSLLKARRFIYEVDDVGLLAVVDVRPPVSAHVHITFWDRRLRGREDLCRAMAAWVLKEFDLMGLFTTIPQTARATLAFAKRVGFVKVSTFEGNDVLTFTGA